MSRRCPNVTLSVLLFVSLGSSLAIADPITIVQHFGPFSDPLNVNGSEQTVTGDWIFTLRGNTDGPDLRPDDDTLGMFLMSVSVSNSGLNLTNVGVLSATFYYEIDYPDMGAIEAGITNADFLGRTMLFREGSPLNNVNLIESGFLDFVATGSAFDFAGISPLVLNNGMTIGGLSGASSGSQIPLDSQVPVPEPTTLVLLGSGLGVLVSCRFYTARRG